MKQLYIKCIIIAILTFWSITAFSYDCQVDGIYYYLDQTTKTASVTSGSPRYSGAVTIPSTITYSGTTYRVTSIGISAFAFCYSLSSIEIPASVTSIGNDAFWCCSSLTSVVIPSSVTSIGEKAFCECNGLTSIEMSSSVTSIRYYTFAFCYSLSSIEIPASVTSIGDRAFLDCSGLTSVTIGKGVTDIRYNTFSGCSKLYTVTINSNYLLSKKLYSEYNNLEYLFGSQVTNYVIGTNVTSISSGVFAGCIGLTSIVVESGNLIYDSRNNCNAIVETASNTLIAGCRNTNIPFSVTSIGESAFSNCSGLTSIAIPSSVTSIGNSAFYGCSGLTSIEIPSSVTSIGESAFSNCSGLTSIEMSSSVTSIGNSAFSNCSGLTSIEIPSSVTSIGESAFSNCSGLTSIAIPSSVTRIEGGAFYGCSGLTSFEIPSSVTSIGNRAFAACSGLTSIVIPSSVTSFGFLAFSGSGLTSVEIPSSVTTIRDWAFYYCRDLTSVILGNGVKTIGKFAFSECSGLTSIAIPSSVTTIDSLAFSGCSGLTSIAIPSSVTRIEGGAFSGSGLTSVTIPSGVTRIEGGVFRDCSGLSSVVIPSSVTSIGNRAFYGCSGLTSITSYITKVFKTGEDAFKGCDIATLYVPKGLAIFYQSIADWNRIIKIVEGAEGCKMTMACNAKGVVLVNDVTAFTNKIAEMEIKDNEENTFVFIPRENCMLDEVTLNGLDVISLVENNTLKAVIPANSQLNVVFSKYVNLTVKQGAIGYTRQTVKADARHTIYIGSLGENKVNTVTFNGVDVTDEVVNGYYTTPEIKGESVLSISFETNSSVKSLSLNNLKVMGYNGEIQIKNIDEPSDVLVYSVDGKLVGNLPAVYGSASIQVAPEELYVVKVGSRVFKVAL